MKPGADLDACSTLMLDMDGTLLDLAFDNFMWLTHIPDAYAQARSLSQAAARAELYAQYRSVRGELEWYCLDHWSERLGLDIVELHRAQRAKIGWLPGARQFLEAVRNGGQRVLLVTNSHPDTLRMKAEVTGLERYFDSMYSAHDFGFPKERREFWQELAASDTFEPASTMFIDDTESVLAGAREFGVAQLVRISRPDSTAEARPGGDFFAVESVSELLGCTEHRPG